MNDAANHVVRIHAAAGLALVREAGTDATRWIEWMADVTATAVDGDIHVDAYTTHTAAPPSIALDRHDFDPSFDFVVTGSPDGLDAQNLVVFLHGRGDSHLPFSRLGAQMALPQTATIALRAPHQLPFGLGFTWYDDMDDEFNVIAPDAAHPARSASLLKTVKCITTFLHTLRDVYHWPLERVFLFGFSQGACVAFHVAMTLPVRLGGVVLIAGGMVRGAHNEGVVAPTNMEMPMLLLYGDRDDVYPLSMTQATVQQYKTKYAHSALAHHSIRGKRHAMIDSREEMLHVMRFFSEQLYLRTIGLDNQSDVYAVRR